MLRPINLCLRWTAWWLLLSSSMLSLCSGFKWTIDETLDSMQILTLSERYMFASKEGPILLPQGDSYIEAKAIVEFIMNINESSTIKYIIYATDYEHHDSAVGLCGETISNYPWVQNALILSVPSSYIRTVRNSATNGLNFIYQARVHKKYPVKAEAWHNVAFQICGGESELLQATISGTVSFHNPYGFIPAELYGIFPFEAARSLAFICLALYYLYLFRAYELSILLLHKAVFAVLFVALAEAVVWFAAYQKLNLTGTPYCCPFPPLVAGALIMQILRQALSRCLLLVVSLGYGIVRPKLLWMEWISVAIVTILYFSIATAYEVSNIVSLDVHPNSAANSNGMLLPSMLIDILFLSWIYLALSSTIRILTEFQQSHKLAMYQKLYSTIAAFSILFILVSFLMSLKSSGTLSFPWQWEWMQQVSWEILNFAALAAVCIICSPSDNSRLLSYVSQLPTEDPDDDEDGGQGVELGGVASYAQDFDSDSGEDTKPVTTQPKAQAAGTKTSSPSRSSLKPTSPPTSPSSQMYSLPSADDEEDEYAI